MAFPGAICDALVALPSTASHRSLEVKKMSEFKYSFLPISANSNKGCNLFYNGKIATGLDKSKSSGILVRASDHSGKNSEPIAPLSLESYVGKQLTEILQANPHLLLAAVDQELVKLRNERADVYKSIPPFLAEEDLHRRLIERSEKQRRRYLVDIMYCLIVHRFVEKNISMFSKRTPTNSVGNVAFWPLQDDKLRSVHSKGLQDLIVGHLFAVIHDQLHGPTLTNIEISIIELGLLYADSMIYGYVLRMAEQRYQLERALNTIPEDFSNWTRFENPFPEGSPWDSDSLIQVAADEDVQKPSTVNGESYYNLRSYVEDMDGETFQSYATSISEEAMSLIEKQMQVLFDLPDIRIADVVKKSCRQRMMKLFRLLSLD
ncbi:UV-B-induced protein At3g17800, chloroplastic-like [Chenopodium quinoa]|uniref:Uncharacterized protein n=1 Tax=Chenopodium quinoa TaxID=63459 RepID=A0A803L671_CHEQI|nr:UV-B-induced protein At3g17800, chloroplastic-like [Chenopodium quinoa]